MARHSDRLLHENDERAIDRRQVLKGAPLLAGAGALLMPDAPSAQSSQAGGQAAAGVGHRSIQHGWPPYPATRVPKETIERFKKQAIKDVESVCKDLGLNSWTGAVRPIVPGMKLCGRAVTMRLVPIQNTKEHYTPGSKDFGHTSHILTYMSEPGDILVFDMGGYMDGGIIGGNAVTMAKHFGVGGIVVDGVTRDSNETMEYGLPVFARGTVSPNAHRMFRTANLNNEPVQVGSISIAPGDIVIGNMDGLVVVPADRAEEIIVMVEKHQQFEQEMSSRYSRGEEMQPLIKHHTDSLRSIDPSLIRNVPKGEIDPRKR